MSSVSRIARIELVTADVAQACYFYVQALGFERVAGDGGAAVLRLGAEEIALVQGPGVAAAYPEPAAANDPWFQHFAIAVSDASAAFERLLAHGATPISRGGPVALPASSGSVTAYKFRDPEGHPLELSQFPDDRWTRRGEAGALFLGVDHTAVAVADLEASIGFYEALGLEVTFRGLNTGSTQDALDGLDGVSVDIVVLEVPERAGPHLELLHYRTPVGAAARVIGAGDVAATRIVFDADVAEILRDPDGHRLELRVPTESPP